MAKRKTYPAPETAKRIEEAFVLPPAAKHVFTGLFILAFFLALFLRFYDLERKPLHHDEGVNAWFLLNLKKDFPAGWKYDYQNYHGPFLFFTHIIPLEIKESIFSLRCCVALGGSFLLLLLWPLRRKIGRAGVTAAAFLLAVSPTNLFFARTNIHETYFAFFTLAAVAAAIRFWESRKAVYFVLMAASAAWVITNKETYVMTAAAFCFSGILTTCWLRKKRSKFGLPPRVFREELVGWLRQNPRALVIAAGVFVFIIVIYYSSLFTNWKGTTIDLIRTLLKWTKTGAEGEGHNKPFWYFGKLLVLYELPILILAALGTVYAFRHRQPLLLFSTAWAVILFLIYSSVPYKTPWLALSFIIPMALLAGYFMEQMFRTVADSRPLTIAAGVIFLVMLFAWGKGKSWLVTFEEYDNDRHMLVYSQTRRDLNDLMSRLEEYARKEGQGYQTEIKIISDEYWPMQWYLRDYTHVGFWGQVINEPDAPIIIGRTTTQSKLEAKLKDTYYSEMYSLRPGVDLVLYLRQHKGKVAGMGLKGEQPVAASSEGKQPGLLAKYFAKINPIGEPVRTAVEDKIDFAYDREEQKPMKSPFSIVWEGFIEISRPGDYTFGSESDDGSWIFIDDKLVVDNGGTHARQYKSDSIYLEPGLHRIRIKYFDSAWGAIMKVIWIPPGGDEGPIPPNLLWH